MNKLRICFGVLIVFLFGALVAAAETPGEMMKKDRNALKGKVLNASTNALDEKEAKWMKEFEKEAKKGILTDIFVPEDPNGTKGKPVFIKFKLHKGDRYYYYADKKAQGTQQEAQQGFEKVAKYQKARNGAQVLVSKMGADNSKAAENRTLTYVERKTVMDKQQKEYSVIRLIYRDSDGVYFYEDVKIDDGDVVNVDNVRIPAADLIVALKKIAQKGLDAVASRKEMKKKSSVKDLLKAYEKLGILEEPYNCNRDSEGPTCRLGWKYIHNGVAYRISHAVTNSTTTDVEEMSALSEKGKGQTEDVIEKIKRDANITAAMARRLVRVDVIGESDGWYHVNLIFDGDEDLGPSGKEYPVNEEELAELRVLAMANDPEGNQELNDGKEAALAQWKENYNALLDELYMKEKFVKTYNPVFDWEEISLEKEAANAWFE